jgi:radical SAM superfamily enzyme YgiQ (UPF0313 family)
MHTLLFKMRNFIAEENRFGRRIWAEMPSSIVTTAAYLENSGFSVDVRDDAFYQDSDFDAADVAAGWISLADGLYEGVDYFRAAKARGCTTVLMLFDDWEGLTEQVMKDFPFIDYAIRRWDVETTLGNLLDMLKSGGPAPGADMSGIVHRRDGEVVDPGEAIHHAGNLNHLVSARKWIEKLDPATYDEFSIRVGSGCPFKCTFCHIGNRPNRYRQIDDVLDELDALPKGAFVRILSADLPQDVEWVEKFCRGIVERGIDINWETDTRFTWLKDVEYLKLMRASGCVELAMGLESYHPDMLNAYKKGYKPELIGQGIANLLEADIVPALNMMIGHPRETVESLQYTEEFLLHLDPKLVKLLGVQFLRPLPGTKISREAEELGLWKDQSDYREFVFSRDAPVVDTLAMTRGEIVYWRDRLNKAYDLPPPATAETKAAQEARQATDGARKLAYSA